MHIQPGNIVLAIHNNAYYRCRVDGVGYDGRVALTTRESASSDVWFRLFRRSAEVYPLDY